MRMIDHDLIDNNLERIRTDAKIIMDIADTLKGKERNITDRLVNHMLYDAKVLLTSIEHTRRMLDQ